MTDKPIFDALVELFNENKIEYYLYANLHDKIMNYVEYYRKIMKNPHIVLNYSKLLYETKEEKIYLMDMEKTDHISTWILKNLQSEIEKLINKTQLFV